MDGSVCVPNTCHICLKEILERQGHPITEEQAWALCYQLCTLLKDYSIDQLGRLIYYCLDWGLDHDVERDLHEALALLVCRMINVNPRTDASLLPIGLPEVIQVCEDRLDGTAQAAHHYKTVCSLLFSETIELYHYIQSYKTCIKVHAWKYVVEEIQSREPLRPCSRTFPSNAYRPPEKLFPFDQLKQVIESKQYTLRKVQVSERKLRERTKEEPCLHERLMAEIRTTDPLELFASCKRRRAVCSCCSNRSQFFTWHNTCSRCDRVVCPSCCVKMRVPYKWCMDLPITFFRKIVLRQSAERDHSHFWRERLSWDCTKVPLVLEALALGSCSQHSLAMRGWHSQDLCIECQGLLEETCETGAFVNCVTGTREI
ncbi:protein spire homolog 2 [Alosa pseudoharengus]|uniref:protein spire homolog 2 n=1 Tax=Alosa pseudoharengus TaxID=34774 RepID=UPI003F8AB1B7